MARAWASQRSIGADQRRATSSKQARAKERCVTQITTRGVALNEEREPRIHDKQETRISTRGASLKRRAWTLKRISLAASPSGQRQRRRPSLTSFSLCLFVSTTTTTHRLSRFSSSFSISECGFCCCYCC